MADPAVTTTDLGPVTQVHCRVCGLAVEFPIGQVPAGFAERHACRRRRERLDARKVPLDSAVARFLLPLYTAAERVPVKARR